MVNEMNDTIRCPMCGKPNSADAEVCRYCHARLTPLQPSEVPLPGDPERDAEEPESALPAWMRDLRDESSDALPDVLPDEEPDLGLETEAVPDADAPADASPGDALWQETTDDAEEEGLPDWLKSLGDDTVTDASLLAAPEDEDTEDTEDIEELSATVEESAPQAEDNLPDWLQADTAEDDAVATFSREDESALPDWLASAGEAEPSSEAVASARDDLPDWLRAEAGSVAEDALSDHEDDSALPDWLAEGKDAALETAADAELPLPQQEEAPAQLEPGAEIFPGDIETEPAETYADLDALEPVNAAEFIEAAQPPQPFVEVDLPEDLLTETPDWLKLLSPEVEEDLETSEAEAMPALMGDVADAVLGDLPPWLEAMRPVEAMPAGGADEDAPVETAGPLAGLRGVLSLPESSLTRPENLGAVGGRLVVTDQQKRQVEALQTLLAEEFVPRAAADGKKAKMPSNVLRWLLGLMLLAAALAPFLIPSLRVPPPGDILPAALAAHQHVAQVQPGQPVLVGVDYSPGFTGEMESAALPVLDDLLTRGATLVFVSTQSTGPGLAVHLADRTAGAETSHIFNLGYLPGGMAGLYTFARAPRMVLADTPDGQAMWQTPALASVHHLDDFAMVVVITEDTATARAWLEQVRPVLSANTPLIMIISAQAEPLVQPYYETNPPQVAGIVTGIEGGTTYAAMDGKTSPARMSGQWSSYSYIVLAAVLLMTLAGLYNLAIGWKEARARREMPDDDDIIEDETS